MQDIKGLLFDIGGVLYISNTPIAGAVHTIATLQASFPIRFLTNTTRRTPARIRHKLTQMGFSLKEEELFTALDATKAYIASQKGSVYTLMTDEATGFFARFESDKPDFVVIGDAYTNFEYHRLNTAFRHLLNGATLIAAAKNKYFKDEDNLLSLDAGGFIEALEFAAQTQAKCIGKPSKDFFHLAVDSMHLEPNEVLMIGDDILSDIKGAQDAGLKTALVKTGKFQNTDLHKGIQPDLILDDVTALSGYLIH